MVRVVVAAKGIAGVQCPILRQVQMVLCDELGKVGRAHVFLLLAQGVGQVKAVQTQLVGHDHIHVIRHTAGDPVVTADGLQPPHLVHVGKSDAVHLVSAVGLQQLAQTLHALAGGVDVGQHQIHNILFADAAGHFRLAALGGAVLHQRVRAQHAGVGGDRLSGGHAHVGGVHAGSRPDALALHGVGHGGKAHGTLRQGHFHMGQHTAVDLGQVLRVHHGELFGGEMAGTGIVVAGDHGRAVVRRLFADQNGSTSHN